MMTKITGPFTVDKLRDLKIGEKVSITGRILSGRDKLHKHLFEGGASPVSLKDGGIYHCGPVVVRDDGKWLVKASGPTTSIREEAYMSAIIQKHGVRVIIGKGGMGPATAKACARFGCVYLEAVGGTAQVLNQRIQKIGNVYFLREFGTTEAMWELDVVDFPAIVAIDARGRSLHKRIQSSSKRILKKILKHSPRFEA
ncbi:MAG: FumA C-terminus/TtdB family hydratase beta subunit [bacterium]